jgi:hypothetical protein
MRNRNLEIKKARKILGTSKNATTEDTRKRYRELAKMWHPDVNSTEEAHIKMQDINKAYALLMKEEFGILDPWGEAERYWWERFGHDPIWGNPIPEDEEDSEMPRKQNNLIGRKC